VPFRLHNVRTGAVFPLQLGPNTLGREDDNALIIDDTSVSRHHARVITQDHSTLVEDLGSSNGTAIGGILIEAPTVLHHGETVYFGNVAFELEFLPATGVVAGLGQSRTPSLRIRKPTDLVRLEGKAFEVIRASQPLPTRPPTPAALPAQAPLESQSLKKGRAALPPPPAPAHHEPVVSLDRPASLAPLRAPVTERIHPLPIPPEKAPSPLPARVEPHPTGPSLPLVALVSFLLGLVVGLGTGYLLIF
jgi:predicted component of type VI protein secretion system